MLNDSMLLRYFHRRFIIDKTIWTISIKNFHIKFGFNRKLRWLFLISLILTSLITFWYAMYTPVYLAKFYDKLSHNARSEDIKLQNAIKILEKDSRQGMIMKAYLIFYQIQSFIRQILNLALETFLLLKWHLFIKLDLQTIPLMMNYTNDVTDETLFIYKAFLDLRRKEPLIRILAFSQCRDISIIIHYHSQCISAKDVTIEYDCPWKWVPECKWFSFMLIFNMRGTNFSINTVSIFE